MDGQGHGSLQIGHFSLSPSSFQELNRDTGTFTFPEEDIYHLVVTKVIGIDCDQDSPCESPASDLKMFLFFFLIDKEDTGLDLNISFTSVSNH